VDRDEALSMHARLARFMFDRQAASYDADPEEANLMWMRPEVRKFWLDVAMAVILWLARD
jgi:hypothetical protein